MSLALYTAYTVNLPRLLLTNLQRLTLNCVFDAKKRKNKIFMEATPLRLLLNKLHLFSRKQDMFIFIQIVALTSVLHVSACKNLTKDL